MKKRQVMLFLGGLCIMLFGVSLTSAQSPGSDLRKLEAEVKKLHDQLHDLEAKLEKARTSASKSEKKDEKGPPWARKKGFDGKKDFGKKDFGKKDFGKWKEMAERFKKEKAAEGKKEKGKGSPWAEKGKWKGFEGKYKGYGRYRDEKKGPPSSTRKAEAHIDHIIRELEELRSQLKKK